ncbi:MAG: sensor histidine kinase [Haloplanus sp.]
MDEGFRALVVAANHETAERVSTSLSSPELTCLLTSWTGDADPRTVVDPNDAADCLVSVLDATKTAELAAGLRACDLDVPVVRLASDGEVTDRPEARTDGATLCLPLGDDDLADLDAATGERLRTFLASTRSVSEATTCELGRLLTALSTVTDASSACRRVVDTVERLLGTTVAVYLDGDDGLRLASTSADFDEGEWPSVEAVARALDAEATDGDEHFDDVHVSSLDGRGALVVDLSGTTRTDALAVVDLASAATTATLERIDRQTRLERLNEATRRLMAAETCADVGVVATETAREVLGLELNSVHLYDDQTGHLLPVAATDEAREAFEEVPAFAPGESLAWTAYQSGEIHAYDDVREASAVHNQETPIRSEVVLPLGDHGVFVAGTTALAAFDDATVSLAKVFAANVEAALDRAVREAELRAREAELERQNDRLEEFASVVSHDLRNPIAVARGNLDMVREMLADDVAERPALDDRLGRIDRAHERMEELVENLLTLARQGRTVGETEAVDLERAVTEMWTRVDAGRLDVVGPLDTVEADPARLRDLFENLFSNAVTHAGSDVTVRVGRLDGEAGFYVADDGPGIPAADRESVFEHGHTTAEDGTGLGLAIVRSVAEAHGWSVRLTESETGGARFEFRTGDAD